MLTSKSGISVALLVEGATDGHVRTERSWLERIWNDNLVAALGCRPFSKVIGISKRDLVGMDPDLPTPVGCEPLDAKLSRLGAGSAFDAAVIAWDLYPRWNPDGAFCRWQETLDLYRHLSASQTLPAHWTDSAQARLSELQSRDRPSERLRAPALESGAVLPLCMTPEFEAVICADEAGVRRVLGLERRPKGWPSGWGNAAVHQPSKALLAPAIQAAAKEGKRHRAIRGRWETNKNEWGEFILRQLLADQSARPSVLGHPLVTRLAEVAPQH